MGAARGVVNRSAPLLALGLLLAALAGGLALLFHWRLAHGDAFPAYSSLRSDPLGTRAWHDSLARLPGIQVDRQFKPLPEIPATPARTLILAGLRPRDWTRMRREEFDALDAAVRGGSRLVLALRAEAADSAEERRAEEARAEERARKRRVDADEPARPKTVYMDLQRRWGANVKDRFLMERSAGAVRTTDERAAGLPGEVAWRSDVYFALDPAAGWHAIYKRGAEPVLVERRLGQGSIVLVADSFFMSNEALQRARAPALLAWVVGPHQRISFDEAHLGVTAQPGVAALARRYGLSGAVGTLLLLAALFVWRRLAGFLPPVATVDHVALSYHPAAGLAALLRRSVAPAELAATCVSEWRPTARETDRARVAAALAAASKEASPVTLYNAAVRALRRP